MAISTAPPVNERLEWLKCSRNPAYFVHEYCSIYDARERTWIRFRLWPAQQRVLRVMHASRLVVVLKARQIGLSWLALGFALWLLIFRPAATVLLFSKRDDEAVYLLDFRIKGLYERLPAWLQAGAVVRTSEHEFALDNGSLALAFPTTGGRSYTASMAIVDEADFTPDLDALINAVKPTVDAGGRLVLLSTVDKSRPQSAFKRIYWEARAGATDWAPVFLGWQDRPGRGADWYQAQTADVLARTGALDDLHQEYPASDLEALAARTVDARFPAEWLQRCDQTHYRPSEHVTGQGPATPCVRVYELPQAGSYYVIGADPAEGNPQSDDSAATVLDERTGIEVAALAGRLDPAVFAGYVAQLAEFYGGAPVMIERNNHGHAVLLWLAEFSQVQALLGIDDRPGWLTTSKSKALAFDNAADHFREGAGAIRSVDTLRQLQAIQGATLAAPEGQHDDRAMSFVLALAAVKWGGGPSAPEVAPIPPADVIWEADHAWWW